MDRHVLDMIDPAVLGERLAAARRARRLTQQQSAETLGVARTTVVAIEKGERRPRVGELITLARLYGRPVGELVREDPATARPDFIVQFRSARGGADSTADIQRDGDIQRFEDLCRWYVELEKLLGAPLPRRYPTEYDVTATPAEQSAEEVAGSERNRLGLGDGPIGDLWGLLETDVGLRVFAVAMRDRRVAGMFLFSEEYGGCIAVNADHPEERRRWSAVHEYAHFLTTRHRAEITVLSVAKRVRESERFADAFARHFLMPGAGLRRRFEATRRTKRMPITPSDVLALSHLYRVSFQAMIWRLEELKLLPMGTWDRLRDLGFKPNRARELIHLPPLAPGLPNLPLRYEALAIQAFAEGCLSEGQLAERLGTDRVGARERFLALTSHSEASDEGDWSQIPLDLTTSLVGAV